MSGIADLVADGNSFPVNIRVIKKFIPFSGRQKPRDMYFLFTDINGDAIEALVDINDKTTQQMLQIGRCYTIDNYIVASARTFEAVVPHPASILFSSVTTVLPIQNNEIPKYHYEFAPYTVLEERKGTNTLLSDFLAKVVRCSGIIRRSGKDMLKVTLLDESGHLTEFTIWGQMAHEQLNKIPVGKVIAIAGAKVTDFEGTVQLETTALTTIDIDPPIPNLTDIYNRLEETQGRKTTYQGYQPPQSITIAQVLTTDPTNTNTNRVTCEAFIKEFEAQRGWYTKRCPICLDTIYVKMGVEVCRKNDQFTTPQYRYCINAILLDNTGYMPVIFFDEAATELIGKTCYDLVVKDGHTDTKNLPDIVTEKLNTKMTFRLRLRPNNTATVISVLQQQQIKLLQIHAPTTPAAKMKRKMPQSPEGSATPSKQPKHNDE